MDNSNNLSNSILQSSDVSFPSLGNNLDSGSDSGSGFFDSISNINGTTWIIIISILINNMVKIEPFIIKLP